VSVRHSTNQTPVVPPRACATWQRSPTPCAATSSARAQARLAREAQQLRAPCACCKPTSPAPQGNAEARWRTGRARLARSDRDAAKLLAQWPDMQKAYAGDEYVVKIRDKEIRTALTTKSLSRHQDPQGGCRSTKTTARSSSG
jgi:methylmalonyl-CoA mutase